MGNSESNSNSRGHEDLVARLAQLDCDGQRSGADSIEVGSDFELRVLKQELDDLAGQIGGLAFDDDPTDQGISESECDEVIQRVKTLSVRSKDAQTVFSDLAISQTSPNPLATQLRQYRLLSRLGQGGMGVVYRARHLQLERVVALKVMSADRLGDDLATARFRQEIRAAGRLDHPNIVASLDAGEANGVCYLALEYIDGADISRVTKHYGTLDAADACEVIRQAAVGLCESHAQGIVHRDLKPSNLMLTTGHDGQPVVKILDMGLALFSEPAGMDSGLTMTGQLMGTLDYMAPEQCDNSHLVDIRADLYSLGATLYTMLCGKPPFADADLNSAAKKIVALSSADTPKIEVRQQNLNPDLAALVNRLLMRDRSERFATPQDLVDAISPFAAGHDLGSLLADLPPREHLPLDRPSHFAGVSRIDTAVTQPIGDVPAGGRIVGVAAIGLLAVLGIAYALTQWWPAVPTRPMASNSGSSIAESTAETVTSVFDSPSGMVAYWPINTSDVNQVMDGSGSGLHSRAVEGAFSISGSGAPVPGKSSAFIINAANSMFIVDHKEQLSLASITVSTWLKMIDRREPATGQPINLIAQTGDDAGFAIFAGGPESEFAGHIICELPGVGKSVRSKTRLLNFSWHHLAMTIDANQLCLYVDGELSDSVALDGPIQACGAPFVIGSEAVPRRRGNLDDIAVFDRALTLDEIRTLTTSRLHPLPVTSPSATEDVRKRQLAWGKHLNLPTTLTNALGMEFCLIPPGEFMMGSSQKDLEKVFELDRRKGLADLYERESPQHRVRITQPFYLGTLEVGQAEFQQLMSTNPSDFSVAGKRSKFVQGQETGQRPVENVSWIDCTRFCNQLSEFDGLQAAYKTDANSVTRQRSNGYRLPTEAEWEYACRAGTVTPWSFEQSEYKSYEWTINSGSQTHLRGMLKPNAFGLYDMHGNVFEWCNDRFQPDFYASLESVVANDPMGPDAGTRRVFRGGSFWQRRTRSRSAARGYHFENFGVREHGLRVLLPVDSPLVKRLARESSRTATTAAAVAPSINDAPAP